MAEQKTSETPSFRLKYFPFGGRALPIRYAAAAGGIAFEDEFFTQEEQKTEKKDGKRRWSGPPEITVYGKDGKELQQLGQSNAILRYVGRISGLYPENVVQRALVDEVLDSVEDISNVIIPKIFMAKDDEEKKTNIAELIKDGGALDYWLNKFEQRLEENEKRGNKNGYIVGDSLTIADLKLYGAAVFTKYLVTGSDAVLGKNKRLSKLVGGIVDGNDKIKAFQEQFDKNTKEFGEKQTRIFKYGGKTVPGSYK